MANTHNESYATFYRLLKTYSNITDIKTFVNDRLIVTHDGRLFFDFSNSERIEIVGSATEFYKINGKLKELGENITIGKTVECIYNQPGDAFKNNELSAVTDGKLLEIKNHSIVFDNTGNIGIITENDTTYSTCKVILLTDHIDISLLEPIEDALTIMRYE